MPPGHDRFLATLDPSSTWIVMSVLASILILIHVRRDCRSLGENWTKYIFLVWIFWPIFYPLWLLVWPGSLRLQLQGKSLLDTPLGWAHHRQACSRSRHTQSGSRPQSL